MIKKIISILFLATALMSCGADSPMQIDITGKTPDSSRSILTKASQEDEMDALKMVEDGYIVFSGHQYAITISKEEAITLGYSENGYNVLEAHLNTANEIIIQNIENWESDPTITSYSIEDCTYNYTANEPSIELSTVQTRQEVTTPDMPRGSIETYGQESTQVQVFAPYNMVGIDANCVSKSTPMGINVVTVHNFGTVTSRSTIYGGIYIPLVASNIYIRIQYQCTSTLGGTCTWAGTSLSPTTQHY